MKICIDPGHGNGCFNGGFGYLEHKGMWNLSNYLKSALESYGVEVILTRKQDEDPSLTARGAKAKDCDLFISEHSNASGGGLARGVECYYSVQVPKDAPLASNLSEKTAILMGTINRGAKVRRSTNNDNFDYYTVMYEARKANCPHVVLIENGFHDNETDVKFLKSDSNLQKIAETQAIEICSFLGFKVKPIEPEHWAQKSWDYLNAHGITINEKRFDHALTRGEFFVLLKQLLEARSK